MNTEIKLVRLTENMRDNKENDRLIKIIAEFEVARDYQYYIMNASDRKITDYIGILQVDLYENDADSMYNRMFSIMEVIEEMLESPIYDLEEIEMNYSGVDRINMLNERKFLETILKEYN